MRNLFARWRLKLAHLLWRSGRSEEAIKVGLSAAKQLDIAYVIVAQWYLLAGNARAAIPLLELAASRGLWEAQQVLAARYFHGEGVPKDVERAYDLATQAAESGSLDCQLELVNYYSSGELREPNFFLAMKYATLAAANGGPDLREDLLKAHKKESTSEYT